MSTSEELFREFLLSLGVPINDEVLANTPMRVVKMYREMLSPPEFKPTAFINDEKYDSLVTLSGIEFSSLCEHHLLPFTGYASVCYLPGDSVLGLSKLARFVEYRAKALQLQERMTSQIASDIEKAIAPRAVGVVVDATHMCLELRGAKKRGTITRTTVLRGDLLTNASLKEEFIHGIERR